MKQTLLPVLFFLAGMIGLTVSVIIICRKENLRQNIFLSLCLLGLSVACIYDFYSSQGKTHEYPKIVLALKSFTFLIAPCSYLYIRNTLLTTVKTRKYDWLHFMPLAINFIYTLANTSKIVDSNFWLSNNLFFKMDFYSFNIILTLIWLFYAYTQNLLLLNAKNSKNEYMVYDSRMAKWLKTFSLMIILLYTSLLVSQISNFRYLDLNLVKNLIISFILILSGILVFSKSSILFDIKELDYEELPNSLPISSENHISKDIGNDRKLSPLIIPEEKIKDYTIILNEVMTAKEPFLKKGFVIRDLSELTEIPIHHLSYLINTKYNLHFQDFVNQKRIEYLKRKIHDKEWKNLSLEGLGWAVGFKSRTTFFRAFIKLTGQSPSEYLSEEKQKNTGSFPATA